ncbi:MAG: protein-disulfide reductase DsbD [Proteobacteria bacterium]|nr:protein-disulfide reductase DsbD [Pseudomonadota bacterium]
MTRIVRWLLPALLMLTALGVRADDFLDPEKAFVASAQAQDAQTVEVHYTIAPEYYMYRDKFKVAARGATLGAPQLPAGHVKFDPNFNKEVETYRGEVRFTVAYSQANAPFTLEVTSQGCADAGLCYPPQTAELRITPVGGSADAGGGTAAGGGLIAGAIAQATPPATALPSTAAPATTSNDTDRITQVLAGGSWWGVIGAFFVMGLLLAFTPCVLPMLPILSSIIAGSGAVTRQRGFMLAFVYALGMSLVYTLLGVAAGLAGEGLAGALQKPWVLITFALLLALLSLSMFGAYELRLPSGLTSRLDGASRKLPGGQFAGVFLMGGLSAVVVSPCVSAPLAGALVFLSKTGDVALGGSALFAMAWGMSVPLLLLGASAGAWLPRSGAWMNTVKGLFGVLLLGVAWWIVQPLLPAGVALAGWGALLLLAGFMLDPFAAQGEPGAGQWLRRASGAAALLLGSAQLLGALSGGRDALQPLAHLAGGAGGARAEASANLPFEYVRSVAELDARLQSAGRPVMLDFYADWCVSCKEMERFTFTDPTVQAKLAGAVLLKADVTANNADDKALLKRFGLFGPPGTLFFDAQGRENTAVRVVGFQDAKTFTASLAAAGL